MPASRESESQPTHARRPLGACAGHEWRTLLAPVTPAVFVREFWARKPLFVKGFAEKHRGFFDSGGVAATMAQLARAAAALQALRGDPAALTTIENRSLEKRSEFIRPAPLA